MSYCKLSFLILFALLVLIQNSAWAGSVQLDDATQTNLAPYVDVLTDTSGRLSPFDILSTEYADQWRRNNAPIVNRGLNNDVFWLRFTLDAAQSLHKEWDLVLGNPLLEYIDLYQVFDDAGPRLIYRQGSARPFDSRVEEHRFFIFPVEAFGPTTYLIRIATSPAAVIPIHAYPSDTFWAPLLKGDIGNWLFFGIILAMATYNGFLYLTIRDKSYLFYVLFVTSFGLTQLSLDGYLFQYLWWSDKGFNYRIVFWLASTSAIFAGLFIIYFLNLPLISKRLVRLMALVIAVQCGYFALSFVIEPATFAGLFLPNLVLFMLLAVGFGIYAWRKGLIAARFFVMAWALFAIGNIVYLAGRSGWVDLPFSPMMASKLGSSTEAMLLAFALAYRIRSLRDDRERARMRAEAQSYFLAQISHEIRTPLNGVLGMTEILSRTPLDKEQRGYIETIQGSGNSLLTLINDILDYSKIEAGKMELYREPVKLRRLAEQQLRLFQSQAEQKRLQLSLDVAPEVPETVVMDVQRFRQILSNLISNAIKYTERGSISLMLSMDFENDASLVVCRVVDTGIGIAPDQLGELFHAYYQIDPKRWRKAGGTGLGLAICQQLATLMGGDIHVSSRPGEGSEFVIRVPYEPAHISESELNPAYNVPGRTLKILVAEDNRVNQKVIEGLLNKLGHHVEVVLNGAQAIDRRKHADFDFDVILMDCEMPEVDGYEATQGIREYERVEGKSRVPIIALTAHALDEVRSKCMEVGMDDFLTKPVNTRRLLRVLEKLLARGTA